MRSKDLSVFSQATNMMSQAESIPSESNLFQRSKIDEQSKGPLDVSNLLERHLKTNQSILRSMKFTGTPHSYQATNSSLTARHTHSKLLNAENP